MRINPNTSASCHGRQAAFSRPGGVLRSMRGFTLLEMMIVMVILSVLVSIGVPAFKTWRENQAVNAAASALLANMKQGRVMAMAENRSVTITFCSTAGGDVRNGWVFDSSSPSQTCDPCATAACTRGLMDFDQFSPSMTISSTTARTFSSRGTAGPSNPTITLTVGGASKTITLNAIGRAYLQ